MKWVPPPYLTGSSPHSCRFSGFGRIRILDKLGRFQDILSPDLYCSEEMRFLNAPAKPHEAMLQPRLEQYTRLHAKWICAVSAKAVNDADNIDGAEASFVPTASPLCGFLLPNGLDNSLMAFTAGGTPVGSLVLTQTGSGIDFKSPPGEKYPITCRRILTRSCTGFYTPCKPGRRKIS